MTWKDLPLLALAGVLVVAARVMGPKKRPAYMMWSPCQGCDRRAPLSYDAFHGLELCRRCLGLLHDGNLARTSPWARGRAS